MSYPKVIFTSLLLCIAVVGSTNAQTTTTVQIQNNDSNGLHLALCEARRRGGRTVLELANRSRYEVSSYGWEACSRGGFIQAPIEPGPGEIETSVVIKGNNATLDLNGSTGFLVQEGGDLEIEFLELLNAGSTGAIDNFGQVRLQGVSILDSKPSMAGELPLDMRGYATVSNRGNMSLRNTVIARSELSGVPEDLYHEIGEQDQCSPFASAGILNTGELSINNSSLFFNDVMREGPPAPVELTSCLAADLLTISPAVTRISNSILYSRETCEGEVLSLGHNTVNLRRHSEERPQTSCGFGFEGDDLEPNISVSSVAVEVRQLEREFFSFARGWKAEGNPSPPGSTEGSCELIDGRGYFRIDGQCLRGAFDNRATPNLHPGLDGLWFDPSNDGQYLRISHYGGNLVLLMWNTFNASGEQEWIYGFGQSGSDEELRVEAFVNGGVALVNGMLQGQLEATPWGQFRVSVNSCSEIVFSYTPLADSIAPQQQTLQRLTTNAAANCSEGPALN